MAWARVQSVSGNALSVTSKAVTFTTANVTAGNKLIVAASVDSSTQSFAATHPCWDGTNDFTLVGSATVASGVRVSMWALDVPTGGIKPTITVTASLAGASIAVLAMEFSGLKTGNTSAMWDGTVGTNSGATTTIANPTYSSTASNELLMEVIGDWGGTATFTIPTSSTADANNLNASSTGDILGAWKNSTNGAESMAYTVTPATDWGQILVAFKLGSTAFTQSLTGGLSFTGSAPKKTSRTLPAAVLSFTGAITKKTSRTLTGGLGFTGAIARRTTRTLAGGLSFVGAQTKRTTRSVSAALGFTGSLPKSTARPLAGVLSFSGAVTHISGKVFTAVLGFTGSQTKATSRTLPGGLSFAGSANRAVQRAVTGALGFAGTVAKATTRPLSGALSFVGNLATAFGTGAHSYFQSLAGSLDFSGSIGRAIQRPLSASLSPSGALNRAIVRALPGATLSFAGGFAKGTGKPLSGSLSFTGSQSKSIGKQLLGVLSFVGGFVAAKLPGLAQIINVINPPVSGSVVAVMVVQLPGGPAIFYLLSYIPDEVPIGEVATFRVQLAGSDGSRPTPDLAPVARVLDSTGAAVLANTTMTGSGVYSVSWTPTAAGAYSVEVRTALSGSTVAAQIPVTVRPRFDPIALAVSDVLVSRM